VQDSTIEWSKAVSLDTAGYHGVVEIPGKMYIRKVCVSVCVCVCTRGGESICHEYKSMS